MRPTIRTRPFCEIGDCMERADYELTGRWTPFDWLEIYVCLVHVPRGIRYLRARTVDGLPCLEVEQRAFEFA